MLHHRPTTLPALDSSSQATTIPPPPTTTPASKKDSNTTAANANTDGSLPVVRRTRSSQKGTGGNTFVGVDANTGTNHHHLHHRNEVNHLSPPPPPQQQPLLTAVPGHLRRKRVKIGTKRRYGSDSYSLWKMIQHFLQQQQRTIQSTDVSLILAIFLWYILGVFSIASSKILLTGTSMIKVHPLSLTLQQLVIGVSLLRFLLYVQYMNDTTSGLKAWPPPKSFNSDTSSNLNYTVSKGRHVEHLIQSAMCFTFGFLATNYAFSGSAASFVETVKAAEPITSATVASLYGIETITTEQKLSLTSIIVGVLLSTLGSSASSTTPQSMIETLRACTIVMTANLCFSYRGLFQKLFRQHPSSQQYDDLNLQFRMQWYGVLVLSVPTFLFDIMPYLLRELLLSETQEKQTERHLDEVMTLNILSRYVIFSVFNGMAFTCYNLASTWILSRISVVHHAALNCIRRVFAVIVTSIFFGVPITLMGVLGIAFAVIGFMSYTHYKVIQQQQQASGSSLSPGPPRTEKKSYSVLPLSIHDNDNHK